MVTDNVMFKIKALLNMTVQHGCTQEEANTAMEKAQALMLQHNLDIRDIQTGEVKDESGKIGMIEKDAERLLWKGNLLHIISKNMMCKVVRNAQKNKYYLFGTKANVETVVEMHNWIILQLEQMALRDFTTYRNQGGQTQGKSWKVSYFYGAINSINKRLSKPFQEFSQGTGTAIIIYNDKAVSEAVNRVFPKLVQSSYRYHNNDGSSYGRKAGENVSLRPQVKLNNNSKMYLS